MLEPKPPNPFMHWVKIVLFTPLLLGLFFGALVILCIGGNDHKFFVALVGGIVLLAGLEWFTVILCRGYRSKGTGAPVLSIVLIHLMLGGLVVFFIWESLFGR